MHVSSFDTNNDTWTHSTFETTKDLGPEMALDWLCEDNTRQRDNNTPCGPLSYTSGNGRFILLSAWSGGRRWYDVITIFSKDELFNTDLEEILDINLKDGGGDEDGDEGQ